MLVGTGRLGGKCVKDDMKLLRLQPECAVFRDGLRNSIHGATV